MNVRKKLAGAALVAVMAATGGVLATPSPASAGPIGDDLILQRISFCDVYPHACELIIEVPEWMKPVPPDCLSCPIELTRLDLVDPLYDPVFEQPAIDQSQLLFGR